MNLSVSSPLATAHTPQAVVCHFIKLDINFLSGTETVSYKAGLSSTQQWGEAITSAVFPPDQIKTTAGVCAVHWKTAHRKLLFVQFKIKKRGGGVPNIRKVKTDSSDESAWRCSLVRGHPAACLPFCSASPAVDVCCSEYQTDESSATKGRIHQIYYSMFTMLIISISSRLYL